MDGAGVSTFWEKLLASLSPQQICVSCILLTVGGGGYALKTFARNGEVYEIRVQQLSDAVFKYRVSQCQAIRSGSPSEAYGRLLADAVEKYEAKTKQSYRLLECSEL